MHFVLPENVCVLVEVQLHALMLFRSLYILITPVSLVSWKQIDIVYLK
jgi:hypothetical protein